MRGEQDRATALHVTLMINRKSINIETKDTKELTKNHKIIKLAEMKSKCQKCIAGSIG